MSEAVTINLDKFVPREYQKCVFKAIEDDGYKRVMCIWPRRCLSGNTFITMSNGKLKLLRDIRRGDEVLSWNGKKFVFDRVKHAWKTESKTTYKLETSSFGGRVQHPIICSSNHKFAVLDSEGEMHWKTVWELRRGGYQALRYSERFIEDLKLDRLLDYKKGASYNSCIKCDIVISKHGEEELYDIETESHHNFVANGYLVHNSGKDITAWNLCIREMLRSTKTIYYVFPTFASGRKILWDAIDNDGFRILDYLPTELVDSRHEQYMRIRLKNGSHFQIIGSDSYDTSLIGTNPHMVIFSEFALSDPEAYKFVRPILSGNDGKLLIVSCVAPETLVIGKNGLQRIKNVSANRAEYSELNVPIRGLGGFHNAEQFYYGGKQKTLKITLNAGYELECTPVHPIWNGREWIKAKDLKVGDEIPVQYGQQVFGEGLDILDGFYYERKCPNIKYRELVIDYDSDDFFYLLGLIHSDGCYNKSQVCITNKNDPQIIDFVRNLGFKTVKDEIHHYFSSHEFSSLLEFIGFKHGATKKSFPDKLFMCNKYQMRSFLQGVFDGDGHSHTNKGKGGRLTFTSACLSFIKDLQIVLLNFGIASLFRTQETAPNGKIKGWHTIYRIEIGGYFAHIFYRDIGFRLPRKQNGWRYVNDRCREESWNIYPTDASRLKDLKVRRDDLVNRSRITRRNIKKLSVSHPHPYFDELLSEKFFYSKIKSIVKSENDVYDFVIPDTHSFFSNGFVAHNTPRGKNFLYEMYNVALQNPDDWHVSHLTVDDTKHISMDMIMKERELGEMSEDLQQQEYFTSFLQGVEGSYYSKYMDRLRLNGQIGIVPWEPQYPVHTSWDIGVRDMTSIIFFQVVGQTIKVIDCYEKNKEGLEHYINMLNGKPYTYGKHVGPHDIRNREFSTGITRWEKARQLGVTFDVADKLSIMDGIEAVRSTLPKMWFDEKRCKGLIKSIENYRQEYDSKKKVYKPRPLHDIHSNFADSIRYLSIHLPKLRTGMTPGDLEKLKTEAMYGKQSNLPQFFR